MSVCAHCGRDLRGYVMGVQTGLRLFCSPMCRDTAQMKSAEERLPKPCPECGEPFTREHPFECAKWQAAMAPIGRAMDAAQLDRKRNGPCDLPGCFVCSGAMRERKGGGSSD